MVVCGRDCNLWNFGGKKNSSQYGIQQHHDCPNNLRGNKFGFSSSTAEDTHKMQPTSMYKG